MALGVAARKDQHWFLSRQEAKDITYWFQFPWPRRVDTHVLSQFQVTLNYHLLGVALSGGVKCNALSLRGSSLQGLLACSQPCNAKRGKNVSITFQHPAPADWGTRTSAAIQTPYPATPRRVFESCSRLFLTHQEKRPKAVLIHSTSHYFKASLDEKPGKYKNSNPIMSRLASDPADRKLVSARCISQIKPLGNGETREVVLVGCWPVVVPKGQFSVDELILYFEIGSFLPFDDKRYEPYRSSHTSAQLHGERGWVVQTVKLARHISQGMVFRLDDQFPEAIRIKDSMSFEDDYDYDQFSRADCENQDLSLADLSLMTKDLTGDFHVKRWATFCEYSHEC